MLTTGVRPVNERRAFGRDGGRRQDQLLQPVVMGSQLNLSPLVVFVAVVVWAWILGPPGALLAVPLTVGLVMILEAFPSSRGLAGLFRNTVEPQPGMREATVL
jgi:hypothetical protein